MKNFDVIVIGAGVIGSSVAFHLSSLGAKSVLMIDQGQIGEGTTSQSSGILRTHYSVGENVELAKRSWDVFNNFQEYVQDPDASCGLVRCGYMIAATGDDKLGPLRESLSEQETRGVRLEYLSQQQAHELLPIASFDDAALIGYEPDAGFADAYMVATSFARAARRAGVIVKENLVVDQLLFQGNKVVGVATTEGNFYCNMVVSAQNIWAKQLGDWLRRPIPLIPERHAVLAMDCQNAPYTFSMPVFKDLASPGMLYCRSYGGKQMLVSEGIDGEQLSGMSNEQGDISLDYVIDVGAQVAERFPAYTEAGLASSWTGIYDVTPDWNPVLGSAPGIDGLLVGFGFSGHGFKLSPTVGLILAQAALGMKTDVSLEPYSMDRFDNGHMLTGKYGIGAVS